MQDFHYTLTDIENMLPWEREIYATLLIERLKMQEQAKKQQRMG